LITESGRIVRREGAVAWVEASSRRDCPRCAEGKGCGGGLLGRWLGKRLHLVQAADPAFHPEGSWVELGLEDSALLKAALGLYLPPLLGLVAGSSLAHAMGLSEWLLILAGVAGFALGLLAARRLSRGLGDRPAFLPRVIRRLPGPPPGCVRDLSA